MSKKSSSAKNDNNRGSSWQDMLSGMLLLGAGVFLILCNVAVFVGIDTRPNTWLFYLNMHYWSVYTSIAMWIVAIWVVSESTGIVEDYLPLVRGSAALFVLLVIVTGLYSSFNGTGAVAKGQPLWLYIVYAVAICCAVRSLFLLYKYWNEGEGAIDFEEAQWFWGWAGMLLAVLAIVGIAHLIPIKVQRYPGVESFFTQSLYIVCCDGLQDLIRFGRGSMASRALVFIIFPLSIAFVYVFGKWILIFASRWLWKE